MTHQGWDVQLTAYAARELLPGRHRALHRRRLGVGADAVAGGAAGGVGGAEQGMTETCPECGQIVQDAQALREWLALHDLVNGDDPEGCGLCKWRYGPAKEVD